MPWVKYVGKINKYQDKWRCKEIALLRGKQEMKRTTSNQN
jgi:hypothetical protein